MSKQTFDKDKNAIVSCGWLLVSKKNRGSCCKTGKSVYFTPGFNKCKGCYLAVYTKLEKG